MTGHTYVVLASERFNEQTDYILMFDSEWQKDEYVRTHNLDTSNLVHVSDFDEQQQESEHPAVGTLVWPPCCGQCRPHAVIFDDETQRDAYLRNEIYTYANVPVVDGSAEFRITL